MYLARIALVALFLAIGAVAYDYCQDSRCRQRHVGCNPTTALTADCPAGAKIVDMNKTMVLQMHNAFRQRMAAGYQFVYPTIEPALRMVEMSWSDELAKLALYNVVKCKSHHDVCRDTQQFPFAGQNIAKLVYREGIWNLSDAYLVDRRIKTWIHEITDTTMMQIRKFPFYQKTAHGDVLLMIADRNTHVGCAGVRFAKGILHTFLLACNYATSNFVKKPTYAFGKGAGSKCESGHSPDYNFLCSTKEVYDLKTPL